MSAKIGLNRSRKVPADETPAFGAIAERFRRAGDLERAVALCQDGLKRFPHNLSARVTLGWSLLDLGRYDEAREALEQVLKRAPDNLAAIRGLAELHDRAEHTMMLPMDGPGQWPPPVDQVDEAAELASTAAALAAAGDAGTAEAFEFPPPLTIPIPAGAEPTGDVDADVPVDVVARAADAVSEAPPVRVDEPVGETPAAVDPPAPVAARAVIDESKEAPVFISASGAPLPVSAVPEFEPVADAAASHVASPAVSEIEQAAIETSAPTPAAAAPVSESALAVEPAVELSALELDAGALNLDEIGVALDEASSIEEAVAAVETAARDPRADAAIFAPAAESVPDPVDLVAPALPVEAEDPEEIAALEALIAQAETAVETPAVPALSMNAADSTGTDVTAVDDAPVDVVPVDVAPVDVIPVDVAPVAEVAGISETAAAVGDDTDAEDDPTAFRLEPQSIMALQAVPTAEELAAQEEEEAAAIARVVGAVQELPLIAAYEAWVPDPDPVGDLAQEFVPQLAKGPRPRQSRERQPAPAPAMATATPIAAAPPALATAARLRGLERFLRQVQARRRLLAAQSVA
jgi:tetratricopeptide (TPR) repeat protein